ncbi:MAG: hypothetical protein IKF82_04645 [Bacilli bacterium]|nr:hypothetical protein [Bacilli bacterium]
MSNLCYNYIVTHCVNNKIIGGSIMKEMAKKPDAMEIVLDDKKLTPIIRRMIEEAIQKGYNKTSVMNAMSQMWRDMVPKNEKIKLELTIDEQAFFEKVDMFFSEYGQAFVRRVSWKENDLNWQNRGKIEEKVHNSDYAKHILDSLIMFTKSVFCTFCREDTITLANIKKYNMELFGRKYVLPCDLYPISCALDDLFVVDGNNLVYVLEKKDYENIYSFSIERNERYRQFIEKYSYRSTNLTKIAMKLIWIVSTYY